MEIGTKVTSALIGHTGFVGGNLQRANRFDDLYNSTNIHALRGKHYKLIVCAGAPGAKWKANREPERDRASLDHLMNCLAETGADHVILISTIDVYPEPRAVNEDSPIQNGKGSAYGKHRRMLEEFVQERFEATIIRLPGLFGPGLKKNVIYDFLHNNNLEAICPESVFQFYPVANTWKDIATVRRHGLSLVNFATEPMSVKAIAGEAFGLEFANPAASGAARYDMRTKHASVFGKPGPYMYEAGDVLESLKEYIRSEGWKPR